jgi:hypothetical protein
MGHGPLPGVCLANDRTWEMPMFPTGQKPALQSIRQQAGNDSVEMAAFYRTFAATANVPTIPRSSSDTFPARIAFWST